MGTLSMPNTDILKTYQRNMMIRARRGLTIVGWHVCLNKLPNKIKVTYWLNISVGNFNTYALTHTVYCGVAEWQS